MVVVADGAFDVSWMRLSKLIGSLSFGYEDGLLNGLVNNETVADCVVIDLSQSKPLYGRLVLRVTHLQHSEYRNEMLFRLML